MQIGCNQVATAPVWADVLEDLQLQVDSELRATALPHPPRAAPTLPRRPISMKVERVGLTAYKVTLTPDTSDQFNSYPPGGWEFYQILAASGTKVDTSCT